MKKLTRISLVLIVCLSIISCKKEQKKVVEQSEETVIDYTLNINTAKISWTAYKTTDKIAVKGEFTKIDISNNSKTSKTTSEVINETEFSIPVSSVFSNNEVRDNKLKQFFFGVMDATELLTGKVSIDGNENGTLTVTMNSITNTVPFTYTITDKEFSLVGIMNLNDWNGQQAVDSLNKACLNLHKAADSISKTWNEVKINASISFNKNQ